MTKPIVLYGQGATPNPIKVAILLEELGIPFEVKAVGFATGALKTEPYISLNPNGRVPAIEDPNTGISLFEVRINTPVLCFRGVTCVRDSSPAPSLSI
jgi:glutathione S-transferase